MRLSVLLVGVAPAMLMAYGWYLGRQHQSMIDLAGIIMFMVGIIGLVLAIILRVLTRKFWQSWYANLLMGVAGCGLVFAGVVVYAR